MNIFVLVMVLFCLLGCIDKIFGNHFGLGTAFDEGLLKLSSFVFSICGFYCILIQFIQANVDTILNITSKSPIDFSIFIGSLLAPDLGGYSIISSVSNNVPFIIFSGVLLTSSIGCTISFQLPIFLGSLEKENVKDFINGLIFGIMTLPIPLLIFGFFLKVDHLLINIFPILIICLLLLFFLWKSEQKTIKVLTIFARFIEAFGNLLFFMVILSYFFDFGFTSKELIIEALEICFSITMIVCGAMVLSQIILKFGKKYISKIAKLLGVNEVSVVGFILALCSSLAMIPLFKDMDKKGKLLNAAFSVSGAYVFGGQLGFVSSVTSPSTTTIYITFKLLAGIIAMIAYLIYPKNKAE